MTFWQSVAADLVALFIGWGAGSAGVIAGVLVAIRYRGKLREWLDSTRR